MAKGSHDKTIKWVKTAIIAFSLATGLLEFIASFL